MDLNRFLLERRHLGLHANGVEGDQGGEQFYLQGNGNAVSGVAISNFNLDLFFTNILNPSPKHDIC